MKTLRQFCVASVFLVALTIPAFAGQIETGKEPPPPQPAQAAAAGGQIETGVTGQSETDSSEATAVDPATEIALNLIENVLSLF